MASKKNKSKNPASEAAETNNSTGLADVTDPIVVEGVEGNAEAVAPVDGEIALPDGADVAAEAAPALTVTIGGQDLPAGDGSNLDYRVQVYELNSTLERGFLDFSECLLKIQTESLFIGWGYNTFAAYVGGELRIAEKQASNLVKIASYFGQFSDEQRAFIRELGSTKAMILVGHITAENFSDIAAKVAGKSVSDIQRLFKPNTKLANRSEKGSDGTTKVSFSVNTEEKVLVEQALNSAKDSAATPGAQLATICAGYLTNNGDLSQMSLLKNALSLGKVDPGDYDDLVELLAGAGVRVMVLGDDGSIVGGTQYLNGEGIPLPLDGVVSSDTAVEPADVATVEAEADLVSTEQTDAEVENLPE